MRFTKDGIAMEVPGGWQVAAFVRPSAPSPAAGTRAGGLDGGAAPDEATARTTAPGATTHPVVHVASFPMPPDRGDYGSGAVDVMGVRDVFVSLVEFHPDASRTPLFAAQPPAALTGPDFSARALQRTLEGQAGVQRFFSTGGRAFCLYVVLGSHARRHLLVPPVNGLLRSLVVEPAP